MLQSAALLLFIYTTPFYARQEPLFLERLLLFYLKKYRQSFRRQSLVAEHLQTIGLPVDTRDWSQIKVRYRQLMKKYHPGLSSNPKTLKISQRTNNAYAELEKQFSY